MPSSAEALLPEVAAALELIARVPGYAPVALALRKAHPRYLPTLTDRGQATLGGGVYVGPEAVEGGVVGLAETLVHEHFHTRQSPLAKTPSFWKGVFTRTPVMARYERPAYQAAVTFLKALAQALPEYREEALAEAEAVQISYEALYRLPLWEPGGGA